MLEELNLTAWTPVATPLAMSGDEAAALAASPFKLTVSPTDGGRWDVRASQMIGVARLPGVVVRVVPRIPVAQLMFLLSYAGGDGWHDDRAVFDSDDLFAAIAEGFAAQAESAIHPAPLAGYVRTDETSPVLRGRIRMRDQLAARPGIPLPLEITYDDFSFDVPENRIVLGAAETLLRFPLLTDRARTRLLGIRRALDGVQPARPGARVVVPIETRLNRRYRSVLHLAELILRGTSISETHGATEMSTFAFDMNKVFEQFVERALADAVARRGLALRSQFDQQWLDVNDGLRLKPDITLWQAGGCVAVADAKYKRLTSEAFPNADAYQMLAYCTAFRLPTGTLIYARDELEQADRDYDIVGHPSTIRVRTIDVSKPWREVLEQVDKLADGMLRDVGQAASAAAV